MSEISVASLQDRITQIEETHYSTNEELQATLQELSDLQDQVNMLQLENEQLETDKAVLYESLCSQTERLEDTRNQVTRLKELLFKQDTSANGDTSSCQNSHTASPSEREAHLIELLKSAQQEYEDLAGKKDELTETVDESKAKITEIENELEATLVNMRQVEDRLTQICSEKEETERLSQEGEKALSALRVEIELVQTQLEREQAKVKELFRERDARASSQLDVLLREMQIEKDKIEAHSVHLQEQLALSQIECIKLTDQLKKAEQELDQCKKSYEKERHELLNKLALESAEKEQQFNELERLQNVTREAEIKCIRHLEDKRELKATINDTQKQLQEAHSKLSQLTVELNETKEKFKEETHEWQLFQCDLLTTVRVANEFKTEAQEMVERIVLKNKKLSDRIPELEAQIAKYKAQLAVATSSASFTSSFASCVSQSDAQRTSDSLSIVSPDKARRSVSVSPVIFTTPNGSAPSVLRSASVEPSASTPVSITVKRDIPITRKSIGKWVDYRNASHMSVKSLIESIENSNKHSKLSSNNSTVSSNISTPITSCTSSPSIESCRDKRSSQLLFDATSPLPLEACDVKLSDINSTSPKSLPLGSKKIDNYRRNPLSLSEMVLEKKDDPLADLVTGGGSKRNALLKWCQNKTSGYKNIDITNFSSSWNDGLAFCALVHTYLPDKIPYDKLDCKDKKRNFALAFNAAESVGIPSTLDIKEMISEERPDWTKIMAYVTSIYIHFET